jgi:hypothetical protein
VVEFVNGVMIEAARLLQAAFRYQSVRRLSRSDSLAFAWRCSCIEAASSFHPGTWSIASRSSSGAVYVPSQTHIRSASSSLESYRGFLPCPVCDTHDVGDWTSLLPRLGRRDEYAPQGAPERDSSEVQSLERRYRQVCRGGGERDPGTGHSRPQSPHQGRRHIDGHCLGLLKVITGRSRPDLSQGQGAYDFHPFGGGRSAERRVLGAALGVPPPSSSIAAGGSSVSDPRAPRHARRAGPSGELLSSAAYLGPSRPHRSSGGGTSGFRSGGILVVNCTPVMRSVLSSRTR